MFVPIVVGSSQSSSPTASAKVAQKMPPSQPLLHSNAKISESSPAVTGAAVAGQVAAPKNSFMKGARAVMSIVKMNRSVGTGTGAGGTNGQDARDGSAPPSSFQRNQSGGSESKAGIARRETNNTFGIRRETNNTFGIRRETSNTFGIKRELSISNTIEFMSMPVLKPSDMLLEDAMKPNGDTEGV
jgi:hypothetical protein